MAVSIRNIEKFFDDHPEFNDSREQIITRCRQAATRNIINEEDVSKIMAAVLLVFINDIENDEEHRAIWDKEFAEFKRGPWPEDETE
jgi:hypothetical protein